MKPHKCCKATCTNVASTKELYCKEFPHCGESVKGHNLLNILIAQNLALQMQRLGK